jgi:hypothetical protein
MPAMDTKTIQVRSFPVGLLQEIKIEMAKRQITLSELLAAAAWEYLRKRKNHGRQTKA